LDGLLVVVEVGDQFISRPVQFAAGDAGGGLGVVGVEAVAIEARLAGGPADVGGDQQERDADEEEERGRSADEAQLASPLQPVRGEQASLRSW
jgi:hypothetical protein